MNRILLLDTNFSAKPIYDHLDQMSDEVIVAGVGTNPKYSLSNYAKNYVKIDYSNVEKMRSLIDKKNIDYIVPGGNDVSYRVCSELNSDGKYYGIDSPAVTDKINNKDKFRSFASKNRLPIPEVLTDGQINDSWPVIVKPVDSYSGRGMTVLHGEEKTNLSGAIQKAKNFSSSGEFFIEEYLDGQLYSHSAFIYDGKIIVDFIVREDCTANPFAVDTSHVVYDFPIDLLNKIRDDILLMVKKLDLVDGLIHTQFIQKNKSYWIIEVTRRCPGDLYSQLIEFSTGFPYAAMYANYFLDKPFSTTNTSFKESYVIRHTITHPNGGIFSSLKFNFPVQIQKLITFKNAGDKVNKSPDRIALLFVNLGSEKELDFVYEETLKRKLYSIK